MAKRISAIVSVSIIGILILATIIMASIKVDYKIEYKNPDKIFVQYGSNTQQVEEDDYSKILSLINNASKKNVLTALFDGSLSDKQSLMSDSSTGVTLKNPSQFYVKFIYNNPQVLKLNDEIYEDSDGNKCYYTQLVFNVENVDELKDVTVYVTPDKNKNGDVVSSTKYTKRYSYKANFKALYDYLVGHNYDE